MSTPRFTAEELDQLRALAAQWGKIVSRRAFGDGGPGLDVDLRTFEQIATVAAQGLTEGALRLRAVVQSEDDRLGRFFAARPGCPFRQRPAGSDRSEAPLTQTAA